MGARNKCGGSITSILSEISKHNFCEKIEMYFLKIKENVTFCILNCILFFNSEVIVNFILDNSEKKKTK